MVLTSIKRIEIAILKSDINIPLVLPLLLSLPSDNRPEQLSLSSVDSQGHPQHSLHPTGQVAADPPCGELENTGQAVPRLQQSFKGTRTVKTEGSAITRTQASASMYRQTHTPAVHRCTTFTRSLTVLWRSVNSLALAALLLLEQVLSWSPWASSRESSSRKRKRPWGGTLSA